MPGVKNAQWDMAAALGRTFEVGHRAALALIRRQRVHKEQETQGVIVRAGVVKNDGSPAPALPGTGSRRPAAAPPAAPPWTSTQHTKHNHGGSQLRENEEWRSE